MSREAGRGGCGNHRMPDVARGPSSSVVRRVPKRSDRRIRVVASVLGILAILVISTFLVGFSRAPPSSSMGPAQSNGIASMTRGGSISQPDQTACGGIGASAYEESVPAVPSYTPPASHGTVITVNSTLDATTGPTTNLSALLASGAPVTLRDAVAVTNNAPGVYTIRFSASLSGTTITESLSDGGELQLLGGNVLLEGNVTPGGPPAVTLAGANVGDLGIESSGNTIYAISLSGTDLTGAGTIGILLQSYTSQNLSDEIIAHDAFIGSKSVGLSFGASNLSITNVQVEGNYFGGLSSFGVSSVVSGTRVSNLSIANNVFNSSGVIGGLALNFEVGGWLGSGTIPQFDKLSGLTIENNTILANAGSAGAIDVTPGAIGSSNNSVENVTIAENHIYMPDAAANNSNRYSLQLSTGDAASDFGNASLSPIVYPDDNDIRNVLVIDNTIYSTEASVDLEDNTGGEQGSRIANVTFAGNTLDTNITGAFPWDSFTGLEVIAGNEGWSSLERPMSNDSIAGVSIFDNDINMVFVGTSQRTFIHGGGIFVDGGDTSTGDSVTGLDISGNYITGGLIGINIMGGSTFQGNIPSPPGVGNSVSGVNLTCNVIKDPPTLVSDNGATIGGITLSGGFAYCSSAYQNSLTITGIADNVVAGVPNAIVSIPNLNESCSFGTSAAYLNTINLPPQVPLTFKEMGLPPETAWSVDLEGTLRTSTIGTIPMSAWDGLENFTVGNVTGFSASPTSGTLNVTGSNLTVTVAYAPSAPLATVSVSPTSAALEVGGTLTFTATPTCMGGPCVRGTTYSWSLTNDSGTLNATTGASVTFSAGMSPEKDSLFVNATLDGVTKGASATVTITSSAPNSAPHNKVLGLSPTEAYALFGGIGILVVAAIAAMALRGRRGKNKDAPKPPAQHAKGGALSRRPPP
jgi:hypothetical protein